jgi:hypothetical protein
MKDCTKCKYAEWERTTAGRLHPSGQGRCTYPWKMPQLPASMHWIGDAPVPWGGYISRKEGLETHCAYFGED